MGVTKGHDKVTLAQAGGCGTTHSSPGKAKMLMLPLIKDRVGQLGRSRLGPVPCDQMLLETTSQANRSGWVKGGACSQYLQLFVYEGYDYFSVLRLTFAGA